MKGNLFVISAPSGAGKTSLINALLKKLNNVMISISHTTREKRAGEQDGVDYHFVNTAAFNKLLQQHLFLEYALVFDQHYGTSKQWVEETLDKGIDVILEIDWQGGLQVQSLMPDAVMIFILPPSKDALDVRLRARNLDSAETIALRLSGAVEEMRHYVGYDYLLVNDDFEQTLSDLSTILIASRLRIQNQRVKYADLLLDLLN